MLQHDAALTRDPKCPAEHRLRGGGAETDDELRFHECDFLREPWPARGDFAFDGLLVQTPLTAWFPFEMLHCVRDVYVAAFDTRIGERAIQHLSGRPDEGATFEIFLVAGLFADHENRRRRGAFTE